MQLILMPKLLEPEQPLVLAGPLIAALQLLANHVVMSSLLLSAGSIRELRYPNPSRSDGTRLLPAR